MYKIGFKFNNNHVWSIEELQELQTIIDNYNWDVFNVDDIIYVSSSASLIYHDFIVIRKDNNIIILEEIQ